MSGRRRRLLPARDLRLLPREALVKTNELDQADWNFRPVLGWVSRLRLRAVAARLAERPVDRLLEVGYGSGVFLPELDRRCRRLFALDLHTEGAAVERRLLDHGTGAHLVRGSACALPFPDATFDAAVAVSTLEFVPDVARAVGELLRVTRPDGCVLAVTPGRSLLLDLGLRLLTGARGEDTFEGRRGSIVPAFARAGRVRELVGLPRGLNSILPLYTLVDAAPAVPTGATRAA